jgi:hypothetical protein
VAGISVTELVKMRQEKQSPLAAVALLIFIIALLKGNVLFCLSFYGTVLLRNCVMKSGISVL